MVDDIRCVLSCSVTPIQPLNYLKSTIRGRHTRIASAAPFSIFGTYTGTAVSVGSSMVTAQRNNLTIDATMRFIGYEGPNQTGGVAIDTGTWNPINAVPLGELFWGVTPLGADVYRTFYGTKNTDAKWWERVDIGSWQIDINDTTNPDGFIDISRLWVGDNHFELQYNPSYGLQLWWDENTTTWDTDGGSVRMDARPAYRNMTFNIEGILEKDRQRWFDIIRYVGMRKDIYINVFPEGTPAQKRDYAMHCFFKGLPKTAYSTYERHTLNQITLREA
jgi:hypothetical protein